MKANPISSGLVNLLLCLHCGAFSRFASFGIASAPKGFLARVVMETQHVEITGLVAWWENVTALACLYKIPLAAMVFCFLHSLCFVQFGSFSFLWFSTSVFPDTPLFWLTFIWVIFFLCVVIMVLCLCVFLFCLISVPDLIFFFSVQKQRLSFCGSFVCEICVSFSKWCCSASWVLECKCKCRMK